jgi:Amt family ammonium transporter
MTQVIIGMMVLGLLWYFIGFSLVFGNSLGGFIGNPATYGLFLGAGMGYGTFLAAVIFCSPLGDCLPMAPSIPGLIFALFELMFSAITPLLITGCCCFLFFADIQVGLQID